MKVDHAKSQNERLLEQASSIIARTIPEQKVDAMKDYHKILRVLKKIDDWRLKPIIEQVELLYMYPSRKLHNSVVVEVNELLEETREKRINDMIARQRSLGGFADASATKWWPLIAIFAGIWLIWR
jgi:hypothetical protein